MSVLTLDEAKEHLNIKVATYDVEVASFLDSAEAVIAARCGPLGPVTVTRRLVVDGLELVLPTMPVLSLTSVTPVGGSAVALADLHLEASTGVVTFDSGARFLGVYDVVYQGGRIGIPVDLMHAVAELLRHFWSTSQRGGSRRPGSADMAVNAATYLLPYQVQSLIEPHLIVTGVH